MSFVTGGGCSGVLNLLPLRAAELAEFCGDDVQAAAEPEELQAEPFLGRAQIQSFNS